ncbi:anti-sigma factor [Actinoplanes sp. CA-030573]|uniref:anti-sigma factor n=1 Tax=Actinoplanes sp. CA-030573 TaxID=3239898 RepID=UPI003D928363
MNIHSLIGAYALDAVDDVERAAFDRHLRECEECRTEVDELREASARLAAGAWSVPPPRLRANVMAAVRTTRQLAPETRPARAARPAMRWRRWAAAAAAVVAVGGVTYAVQDQRVRREHAAAEAARADEAQVRAVLAAPDLVVRDQVVTGGGRVTVAVSRLRNAGVIMLAADSVPGGRVYQLWTVRGGAAHSEGALDTGQTAAVRIVEGIDQASGVGVTLEPPGGSATPTLPMVAALKIT